MSPHVRRIVAELDERLRAENGQPRGFELPFNGTLGADEQRMLDQCAFEEITA